MISVKTSQEHTFQEAIDLFEKDQFSLSRTICKQLLNRNPEDLDATLLMGRCEIQLGEYDQGLAHLKNVAQFASNNAQLMLEIGNSLRLNKQQEEAVQYLQRALELGADKYTCYLELGFAYKDLDDYDQAEPCFLNALQLNPSCFESVRYLSRIYRSRGLGDKAKAVIRQYLARHPDNPHAHAELAQLHLALSEPSDALKACDDSLKAEPAYTRGFALKCIALNELDRREELLYLFNSDKVVQRIRGKCPSPFKSTAHFCKHLARYILSHPSLSANNGNYLGAVNGYHTGYDILFNDNKELGAKVQKMILHAVDEYISRLKSIDPYHPILTTKPTSYRIRTWAVVTEFNGYAAPHIHPRSWIGGAFYVQLPDDFKEQPTEKAGWIEFGRGESEMHKLREPYTISYEPVVGDFVIFPGYFWHNTIPLQSTQKRICMPFDLEAIHGWGK